MSQQSSPVTEHTPTPWTAQLHHAKRDGGRHYAFITAAELVPIAAVTLGVEGYGQDEGRANAAFIVKAVNNHAAMLKSLESCAKLFDLLAVKLDRWATESQTCGWSTHQVSENLKAADDCRRYASQIRTAISSSQATESTPND